MNKLVPLLVTLCAVFGLPGAGAQSLRPVVPPASAPVDDALFRALGGRPGIARIVDDFVPRLATGPRTGEFFRHADQAHLRQMLAEKFCQLSGGGCAYTGLDMPRAHADMDISRADFDAVVETLQAAMDAQGVPFATQNRLLARLAPLHREIVSVH